MQLTPMEVLALIEAHVKGEITHGVNENRMIELAAELKAARQRERDTDKVRAA